MKAPPPFLTARPGKRRKLWEEMHRGAQLQAPRFFYYAAKYLTPLLLLGVFVGFALQPFIGIARDKTIEGVTLSALPAVWAARLLIIALLAVQCYLIRLASKRWENAEPSRGEKKR